MTIDSNISNYIDIAIERERKIFSEENHKHMTALKNGFMDQVKILAELVGSKPDEYKVREIVQEEMHPLKSDVQFIKEEIGCMNGEMGGLKGEIKWIKGELVGIKKEMRQHNHEMRRLRLDVNAHDKRFSTIENMLV